jgi:hypothetical protein
MSLGTFDECDPNPDLNVVGLWLGLGTHRRQIALVAGLTSLILGKHTFYMNYVNFRTTVTMIYDRSEDIDSLFILWLSSASCARGGLC